MKKTIQRLPRILCGLFMLCQASVICASDIIEVLPLTDQILMVRFDDGSVKHHKLGESRNSDVLTVDLLNLTNAMNAASYQLSSTDDSNYSTAKNPSQVGRKSKGTEYTMNNAWDANWRTNSWASEHWIYLHLPNKMQAGKNYTLSTGSLAKNKNSFPFSYNEKNLRSEAVHVNQVGYLPSATKKIGYVYHWMGDKGGLSLTAYANKAFWIVDAATGDVKHTGALKFRAAANNEETSQYETPNRNFLGAEVYECDFSTFNTAGKYRLAVEGIGCSFPFEIGDDIYRAPFKTTARGLYHNRSGIELTSEFTEFTRPAPHNPTKTTGFSGKLRYSTVRSCDTQSDGGDGAAIKALVESGDKGTINTWGWYQDAGDWDGYPSHLRIPALLLLAYEMAPEKFIDNELNIPGKNNTIPDILDEARWLIEYLHRTRHAIMDAGYGTGGVSGRVCGDYWGSDITDDNNPNGSWGDMRTWYVFGEDPMNTYMYAGLAAQYAYLLKLSGKTCPTSVNWEQEAIEAYAWAKSNTKEGDEKAPNAQINLKDTRAYASVNLYKLTGKNEYHSRFIKDTETVGRNATLSEDVRLSVYSYILLEPARTLPDVTDRLKSATAKTADTNVSDAAARRSCRWGGNFSMPMLVGHGTTPWIIDALMDYRINNDAASLTDAITTVDYFMGINPLNQIWYTGEKADISNPERRHATGAFHMDSWYNTAKEVREVPGFAPYGPWKQERRLAPDISGDGNNGWWCNEWSYNSAYPVMQDNPTPVSNSPTAWPGHELWFNQRYSPLSCENTVHQNTVHWAISTGLLCKNVVANPFDANRLPAAEPFEELPDDEGVVGEPFIVADFETIFFYSDETIDSAPDGSYKFFAPNEGLGETVANPIKAGLNSSENVLKFTKSTGEWQLWGFEPKGMVMDNLRNYSHFEFLVSGDVNEVQVVINKPVGDDVWVRETVPVSAVDGWQKVSVELPSEGDFNVVLVFVDKDVAAGGTVSYYDDICFIKAENALLIADFDTKILYDDAVIASAPDGCFKLYATDEAAEQPIENPDKTGINVSEKVMKVTTGGQWSLFGLETKGQTLLDISQYTGFEFKIKGDVTELYIQFANEDTGNIFDIRESFSVDGEWKAFKLDISGKSGQFSNINVFPNPEVSANEVFYIDDIKLIKKAGAVDQPDDKESLLLLDFESIELGWGAGQLGAVAFAGDQLAIVANPNAVNPNASARVLSWNKDAQGGNTWGGYFLRLASDINLDEWTHFIFDVYSEEPMTKASVAFTKFVGEGEEYDKGRKTDYSLAVPAKKWTTITLPIDAANLTFGDGAPMPSTWDFNQFTLQLACSENDKFVIYADNIRLERLAKPDTPTNVKASEVVDFSFNLSWDAVTNIAIKEYIVCYREAPGGSPEVEYKSTSGTSLQIADMDKGKTYLFLVKAVAANGMVSELSSSVSVEIPFDKPDAPTNLRVSNSGANSLTLAWNAVTSMPIAKYEVYRNKAGETEPKYLVGETTTTSLKINDLSKGNTYYFAVKAIAQNGKGSDLSQPLLVNDISTEMSGADKVSVYPNPVASGSLIYIEGVKDGEECMVTIFDLAGNVLKKQLIGNDCTVRIDQNSGVYFIHIASPSIEITKKIVVY